MKIAVDVMSGEKSPEVLIDGALHAVEASKSIEVLLVGDENLIESILKKKTYQKNRVEIIHASDVISMKESPATACRRKKDSSVMVASKLVADKKAAGFFSPGNTGATLTASLMNIKRIEGVSRPAIATILPTLDNFTLLLDAGANVDCTPIQLAEFSIMGEIFMKYVLDVVEPKVGLLNIGEEDQKGNEVSQKTFEILKHIDFNFVGNIEGHDIFEGSVDVVVCDGFIGNIVLKVSEGLGSVVMRLIKHEMIQNFKYRFGAFMAKDALLKVKERFNPKTYGGAPLLGVNGCAMVGHGSSDETATMNGILTTAKMAKAGIHKIIKQNILEYLEDVK